MAAPSAPDAPRYSPIDRPRAAIATDGTLAAIVEEKRVVVLELPGGEPFAEVGVDPAASANEVAWIGMPPRLMVLSRYPEHTRVHLVDPHGPRAVADLRLEMPLRLAATCGAHALVVAEKSAMVITASDTLLASTAYPARAVPANAGSGGANFLVAHADSVEEWDPQTRMPKRRLKLPRPATITALGGSDRAVWMTTQQEPSRLDVLALVDRGQPKAHDLPEPIVHASGHPRSDLVVCVGESGKIYVVDLDGRSKLRTLTVDGIDHVQAAGLVIGRVVGVLAAQVDRPIVIVTLDQAPEDAAPPPRATPTSMPAATPESAERKRPPPPPGRSGTTIPPPIVAATVTPPPTRSATPTTPPPMEVRPPAPPTTPPAPAAATLARPATRAFARAPTPHPRATSEGVEVDLEGVFDDLSADGVTPHAEQFDSPLAFEAKPVADHVEPATPAPEPPPPVEKPKAVEKAAKPKPVEKAPEPKAEPTPVEKAPEPKAESTPVEKAPEVRAEPTPIEKPVEAKPVQPARRPSEPTSTIDDSGVVERAMPVRPSQPVRRAPRPVTIREAPPLPSPKPAWRDEIVFFTYEVFDGVVQRGAPIASPIDELADRFDLPPPILPALVVLYGAHLAGERGVAPVHVARVTGSWDEALGRGLLAGRGLATFADSRVRIAGPIQRMLDEVAVETGALVGQPGHVALPGPHAVVAAAETPLKVVAVRHLAHVGGGILAAHDDADLAELFVEARARGAVPMFRISADELLELGTESAILVVTDEEIAESLGVPRLG